MPAFDTHKTAAMTAFLARESDRVTGLSIEADGVFIYTESAKWCDDNGSGTFRADSETAAIRAFYDRVQPGNGDAANPQPVSVTRNRTGSYTLSSWIDSRLFSMTYLLMTEREAIESFWQDYADECADAAPVTEVAPAPDAAPVASHYKACTRETFRDWFSAVRYCRNTIRDTSPLGPYFGLWHLISSIPDQAGLQRRDASQTRVAAIRAHAFDLARYDHPEAPGKHYRRLTVEAARRSRELFHLAARLPR